MTLGARISEEAERKGLDISEHGGSAYSRGLKDDDMDGVGPAKNTTTSTSSGAVAPDSQDADAEAKADTQHAVDV